MHVEKERLAKILTCFLRNPLQRSALADLLELTTIELVAYLLMLQRRNHRLPVDLTDPPNAVKNLAIDILCSLFASKPNRPYFEIFDFFTRKGHTEFDDSSSERRVELYLWLLRGYSLKQIGHLRADADPQLGRLKRRIFEALEKQGYKRIAVDGSSAHWALPNTETRQIAGAGILPPDRLAEILEQAYLDSRNVEEWCRVFALLVTGQTELPSMFSEIDFIVAVTRIYSRFVIEEAPLPLNDWSPTRLLLQEQYEIEISATIAWLRSGAIREALTKGRFTHIQAECYPEAAESYLRDAVNCGNCAPDSLASYFRSFMPVEFHGRYVAQFKSPFEAFLRKSMEEFKNRVRENSTIRRLRAYWELEGFQEEE